MIFSRDAIQAKIQEIEGSPAGRSRALLTAAWTNVAVGVAFFLATFFTSRAWGSAISFQATSTALVHGGVLFAVQDWLRQPNADRIDVIGGAFLVMLLLLLQTTLIWGNLSSGFLSTSATEPCFLTGNGGDHAVSILSGVLLLSNICLGLAAYKWRSDFVQGAGRSYVALNTNTQAAGASLVGLSSDTKTQPKSRVDFDDDVEGGL